MMELRQKNYYKQPPFMRIISTSGEALSITFPQNITREDFDRMMAEIRMALDDAELKGEQKAMAFLMGDGAGKPIGIVGQPELTPEQAKYFEAREKDGWHSYGTPPDPIPEAEDHEPAVTEATESELFITKATIGNLDGWRYCVMRVKDDGNAT